MVLRARALRSSPWVVEVTIAPECVNELMLSFQWVKTPRLRSTWPDVGFKVVEWDGTSCFLAGSDGQFCATLYRLLYAGVIWRTLALLIVFLFASYGPTSFGIVPDRRREGSSRYKSRLCRAHRLSCRSPEPLPLSDNMVRFTNF